MTYVVMAYTWQVKAEAQEAEVRECMRACVRVCGRSGLAGWLAYRPIHTRTSRLFLPVSVAQPRACTRARQEKGEDALENFVDDLLGDGVAGASAV